VSDQSNLRSDEAPAASVTRPRAVSLIIYASFGIVRGQFVSSDPAGVAAILGRGEGVIEIREADVEHYSNHLPTGSYQSLFINLQQVSGFVIPGE